jgi:hypothetical protein
MPMTTALASERRSITPRMNAGTERRPLASTAFSALPVEEVFQLHLLIRPLTQDLPPSRTHAFASV